MRVLPQRFSKTENDYTKSVSIGRINNQLILFDSHGDIVDISSSLSNWKIKRVINKLREALN